MTFRDECQVCGAPASAEATQRTHASGVCPNTIRYAGACEDCEWSVESTDHAVVKAAVARHARFASRTTPHDAFYVTLTSNPGGN